MAHGDCQQLLSKYGTPSHRRAMTIRMLCMDVLDQALSGNGLAYLSQCEGGDIRLTEIWELMDRAWERIDGST